MKVIEIFFKIYIDIHKNQITKSNLNIAIVMGYEMQFTQMR